MSGSLQAPRSRRTLRFLFAGLALTAVFGGLLAGADKPAELKFATAEASRAEYDRVVAPFFTKHCITCHGPRKAEGELALDKLDPDMKSSTSAARWVVLLEKLTLREMPPEGRPRPDDDSVQAVAAWVQAEMKRASKHLARRQAYANGNKVPHALLFDAKQAAPFDAAPRLRRLSPEIYAGLLNDLAKGAPGLGQPFSPEGKTAFKDMGTPKVDEPITAQLLRNALQIVERQTAHKVENGQVKGVGQVAREFLALLDEKKPLADADVAAALKLQFTRVLQRQPSADELKRFTALLHKNVRDASRAKGVQYTLAAVFLLPEAIFRAELGAGPADEQGRVRLAPREIAFALAYALTDRRPDPALLADADQGKLNTREGVAAAVRRLLDDLRLPKPRILRFFREYFGYEAAREVFKNDKDNPEHDARALVEDTDRLVEYVLEQDRNVLAELLTTNKSFVAYKAAAATKKKRAEALAKFEADKQKNPDKFKNKKPPKVGRNVFEAYNLPDYPDTHPVELPPDQRAGILTQPAWLVAQSTSDGNHAIHRGKWVRERLLGGVVPDLPITVDAQLPEAPDQTLRQRMEVTRQEYCWKCHQLMNHVGLPFEMYDHFGRFRTEELGKPVDATGAVEHVGDPLVEGAVPNAVAMLRRLAASERVEQVFVRHAFRYWAGRNESPGDAASLRAAHQAYRQSGGSMKALLTALLTSDAFLYRMGEKSQEPRTKSQTNSNGQ